MGKRNYNQIECKICGKIKKVMMDKRMSYKTCGDVRCINQMVKYKHRKWLYKNKYKNKEDFVKIIESKEFLIRCLKDAYEEKFGKKFIPTIRWF